MSFQVGVFNFRSFYVYRFVFFILMFGFLLFPLLAIPFFAVSMIREWRLAERSGNPWGTLVIGRLSFLLGLISLTGMFTTPFVLGFRIEQGWLLPLMVLCSAGLIALVFFRLRSYPWLPKTAAACVTLLIGLTVSRGFLPRGNQLVLTSLYYLVMGCFIGILILIVLCMTVPPRESDY